MNHSMYRAVLYPSLLDWSWIKFYSVRFCVCMCAFVCVRLSFTDASIGES